MQVLDQTVMKVMKKINCWLFSFFFLLLLPPPNSRIFFFLSFLVSVCFGFENWVFFFLFSPFVSFLFLLCGGTWYYLGNLVRQRIKNSGDRDEWNFVNIFFFFFFFWQHKQELLPWIFRVFFVVYNVKMWWWFDVKWLNERIPQDIVDD